MRRSRIERTCIDQLTILLESAGWFPRSLMETYTSASAQKPTGLGVIEPDLAVRLEGHILRPTLVVEIDDKGPGLAYAIAKYGAWIRRHGLPEIWNSPIILVSAFAEVQLAALRHHEQTTRWVGSQVTSLVHGGLLRHEVVTLRGQGCTREERGVQLARRCFHRIQDVLSELRRAHPVDTDEFCEGLRQRLAESLDARIRTDSAFRAPVGPGSMTSPPPVGGRS